MSQDNYFEDKDTTIEAEGEFVPSWVQSALVTYHRSPDQAHSGSPDFLARCVRNAQDARQVASTLALLRSECRRVGFVPLGWKSYVEGLAKVTGESLTGVLAWLGIQDLSDVQPTNAKYLARFAHELGLSLQEMLILVRIEIANRLDGAPMPLLIARRRAASTHSGQITTCDIVLRDIEAEYDHNAFLILGQIQSEISAAYDHFKDSQAA